VGLRVGLDWCGKSHPTRIRSPDRSARRQSLYRLRYPAHRLCDNVEKYGRARQTIEDNIIRRMRITRFITKATTHTHV